MEERAEIIAMTADIVSAYVGANSLPASDLPTLIQSVHRALSGVSADAEPAEVAVREPAVPVKRSITPEFLICLEDGRKFKSLKRHLRTKYNMSPEDYRAKWGLAKEYPMVAPNYAKARSDLAKQMGLGQGDGKRPASARERSLLRSDARRPVRRAFLIQRAGFKTRLDSSLRIRLRPIDSVPDFVTPAREFRLPAIRGLMNSESA